MPPEKAAIPSSSSCSEGKLTGIEKESKVNLKNKQIIIAHIKKIVDDDSLTWKEIRNKLESAMFTVMSL